jgi:hypothetical protein
VWRPIATDEWIEVTLVVDACQAVQLVVCVQLVVSLHLGEKWRFMANQGDVHRVLKHADVHRAAVYRKAPTIVGARRITVFSRKALP